MRVFCQNFNGILNGVVSLLESRGELTDNYHEADVFLLWQDVRGDCRQLAEIAKNHLGKPVYVVQHGRGATRDYCHPNKFPMTADKVLVWGEAERQRLLKAGFSDDRIAVVGCPLFSTLTPKNRRREGLNVLYVPVIGQKEEPENLLVHAELKKWEAEKLQTNIHQNWARLKSGWATKNTTVKDFKKPDGSVEQRVWDEKIVNTIPRGALYSRGLVNVKLSPVHDLYQYQSPVILSSQADPNHLQIVAEALSNTDVMVCLEDGTLQLQAFALDIPVILVDIFKYGNYGGVANYDEVEKIASPAVYRIKNLNLLGQTLDMALSNPEKLRKQRIATCEDEGGAHLGDANENIVREIEKCLVA